MDIANLLLGGSAGGATTVIIVYIYFSGKFKEQDLLIRQLQKEQQTCSNQCEKRFSTGELVFKEVLEAVKNIQEKLAYKAGQEDKENSIINTLLKEIIKNRKDSE